MTEAKGKRKPNTMYALVRDRWGDLRVEPKSYLRRDEFNASLFGDTSPAYFTVLCDDQPKHVLEKMMLMAEET